VASSGITFILNFVKTRHTDSQYAVNIMLADGLAVVTQSHDCRCHLT